MERKLDAPLQSPRRRPRFKPTPLSPIIVEEESDLLSPRSPPGGHVGAIGGGVSDTDGATPASDDHQTPVVKTEEPKSKPTSPRFQVTSV